MKRENRQKRSFLYLFIIFTLLIGTLHCLNLSGAQEGIFSISGKILLLNNNKSVSRPIYIFLVDKNTSRKPLSGLDTLVLSPSLKDIGNGYITY